MQKNKGKTRNVSGIKKKLTTRRKKIIKTMAMKHNSKSRRRSEKKIEEKLVVDIWRDAIFYKKKAKHGVVLCCL